MDFHEESSDILAFPTFAPYISNAKSRAGQWTHEAPEHLSKNRKHHRTTPNKRKT